MNYLMVYCCRVSADLLIQRFSGRAKRIRQRQALQGLLSGLLYFLVLFAVSWAHEYGVGH
ncbi:MAG: hypothetical protein ACLR0U_27295 [Enterocloster clostridioformis]